MNRHLRPGLWLLLAAGCAEPRVPDPQTAADRFAAAARRGDADTIYEMLSDDAKRTYGRAGTRRLVADSKQELQAMGKALQSDDRQIEASGFVRYADGEVTELEVEDGRFKLSSAATLPAGARTPEQALVELRQALARRSYAGLVRVLTEDTRSELENDLRSLVNGLEDAEALDVRVTGDTAVVNVPGGHQVKLKREAGVWRVEDFD